MPVGTASAFFGRVAREKVIFACSMEKNVQKKVKEDLKAAAEFHQEVARLVFFTTEDVPVGRRHKLQRFAQDTHGILLEVFDAHAISELLVEPELFWMAQQYLSVSSDFVLALPRSGQRWYEEVVKSEIDAVRATESEFYRLRDAVRFATHDSAYRSDLPGLIKKLGIFQSHPSPRVRRRAFYEEFVASLRGLEDIKSVERGLPDYISEVERSEDPSDLHDGAIIFGYSIGAQARGLLQTSLSTIAGWKKMLLARVDGLLREEKISPGRKCSLLSTKGFLCLFAWIDERAAGREAIPDSTEAITIWRSMIKEVRGAPLFPLETFSRLLSQLAGGMASGHAFSLLVRETDKLLGQRFGQHKVAEQAFERAESYYAAGETLEAIAELHKARTGTFTEERASDSVQFCIFLAKMYAEVGLHFAAKWYGLGAAFAALRVDDNDLRGLAYRGLAEAASADYATGASMEFFLTARIFLMVTREFSMAGNEQMRQFEWSRIDFYSLVLTRTASYLDQSLHQYLKDTVLKSFGADEIYDESTPRLDDFFGPEGISTVIEKTTQEGILPPFSDAGQRRRVAWHQMSARWFVEWPNDYQTAQIAEGFCATLQIFLEDLHNVELSLMPADVFLNIELHDGNLEIKDNSDNKQISLDIHLPRTTGGMPDSAVLVHSVAACALQMLSAISRDEFLKIHETRFKMGLMRKLLPYASYDRLFREFYCEEDFAAHYNNSRGVAPELPRLVGKTSADLSGPSGAHPAYDEEKSKRLIQSRYEAFPGLLRYTLPRLETNPQFVGTVRELREQGWKDWHILQAMANIRMNHVINATLPRGASMDQFKKAGSILFTRDEVDSDPAPPAELFTVSELKRALIMSQPSTLKGLGFTVSQRAPNFEGLDRFLSRFNYWVDDVPHNGILPE